MLSDRCYARLRGVDSRLIQILEIASEESPLKFIVTDGLRTEERQRWLYSVGASKTLKSKHLTGHAVDVAILDNEGNPVWDWPLYERLSRVIKAIALDLSIPIIWGGDWKQFRDGPHYELNTRLLGATKADEGGSAQLPFLM